MRRKVVLYNPRAVFWTMPLALVAIGAALDHDRFEIVIVDGRLESDPLGAVLAAIDRDTVCLGVTVLTGAPIRDAIAVTRGVQDARPRLPIAWGGWHPSLFPEQCVRDAGVQAAVIGQGELTFAELVDRWAGGRDIAGVAGIAHPVDGRVMIEPPRPTVDVNTLPDESVAETMAVLKKLRAMSPLFDAVVYFYQPYPGSPIADLAWKRGYPQPASLEAWAGFDYVGAHGPWVTPEKWRLVQRFKFYQRHAFGLHPRALHAPLGWLSRARLAADFYRWPVEQWTVEAIVPPERLS